jgi:hypothetical protein
MSTQQGDRLFNADNQFKWSPGEDWGVPPKGSAIPGTTLFALANGGAPKLMAFKAVTMLQ